MNIDPRIKLLSHSSIQTKHSCARLFQLQRLNSQKNVEELRLATNGEAVSNEIEILLDEPSINIFPTGEGNIHFAFGHIVGEGLQLALQNIPEEQIIWKMFLGWHADLEDGISKKNKTFWDAVFAVQKFIAARQAGLLEDYELVYYEGKPACELSFCIAFPDGFKYRGYVDAVLRHKVTGAIIVFEAKTTGNSFVNAAMYKNSAQAVGYSIVLDVIAPGTSSYEVLYFVYKTTSREFEQLPFQKSLAQRALWIQHILIHIEEIKRYEELGVYPMNGDSCLNYGRECEYINSCTMSTDNITKPWDNETMKMVEERFQINLSLVDLINSQISRA